MAVRSATLHGPAGPVDGVHIRARSVETQLTDQSAHVSALPVFMAVSAVNGRPGPDR